MSLTTLRHALIAHDYDQAQIIFDAEQLDMNGVDLRHTLLGWAVDRRDPVMAKWLLDRGANPNVGSGPDKESPLSACVRGSAIDVMEVLMDHGADINLSDAAGMTPLMRALQHQSSSLMLTRRLLKWNPDVSLTTTRDGDTALMIAVNEGRLELLQTLADAGVDPNQVNREGRGALHVAVKVHRQDLLEEFLAVFPQVDLDAATKTGLVALAQSQSPAITMILLQAGANPAVRSTNPFDDGRTPLMMLMKSAPDGKAIALALRQGAPMEDQSHTGVTILGHGVEAGNVMGLELLYAHGLSPQTPCSRTGLSPYHLVLRMFKAAMVARAKQEKSGKKGTDPMLPMLGLLKVLSQYQVPVDLARVPGTCDLPMSSPLAEALVEPELFSAAQWLIDAGADVNARGPNGRAPAHALAVLDARLTRALRQSAGVIDQIANMRQEVRDEPLTVEELEHLDKQAAAAALTRAEVTAEFQQAFALLKQGAVDWSVVDNRGWTPMEMAIREGAAQLAAALVAEGVPVTEVGADGLDTITLALHAGQPLVLHAMIEATSQAGHPWTPSLDALVLATPEEPPARRHFLMALASLSHHPQWDQWVSQTDANGNTPLLLAAATGQGDLVEVLVRCGATPQINQANHLGETPLIHAAAQNDWTALNALTARGADTSVVTPSGLSAQGLLADERDSLELLATGGVLTPERPDASTLTSATLGRILGEVGQVPPLLATAAPLSEVLKQFEAAVSQGQPSGPSPAQALLDAPLSQFGRKPVSRREQEAKKSSSAPVEAEVPGSQRPTRRRSP